MKARKSGDGRGSAAGAPQNEPADVQPTPSAAVDEYAEACTAGAPRVAVVGKYSDRVPVQLKSRVHLERLIAEHGAGAVEVQS